MRKLLLLLLFVAYCAALWGQNSSGSTNSPSSNSQSPDSATTGKLGAPRAPNRPPHSDRVNVEDLGDANGGTSSSKDTQVDLAPPAGDDKAHPQSSEALVDAELGGGGDVGEFHPWDPHRAAKDVEVGDFYFKRRNYRAAEDRYREALLYKPNDAIATYRLALSLEKLDMPDAARKEYAGYLQILPHGPQAEEAKKAIDRLNPAKNPTGDKLRQ